VFKKNIVFTKNECRIVLYFKMELYIILYLLDIHVGTLFIHIIVGALDSLHYKEYII